MVAINTITPVISAKLMTAITEVALNSMILLAAIYALFRAIDYLIMYFNNRCSAIIQNKVEIKIKEDVSKELFELEMKNFDKEGTGFFANRIDVEPRVLAGIFSNIRYYLISILTSIGVLIFVVYTNPIIGLFLMFSSMINFFIQKNRIKQWEEERKKSNARKICERFWRIDTRYKRYQSFKSQKLSHRQNHKRAKRNNSL